MDSSDIVLYNLASIDKEKCGKFKIIQSKTIIAPGEGISIEEICRNKYIIRANNSGGGNIFTQRIIESNITASPTGNTALQAIMFTANTVNKITINIAATYTLPSSIRQSSWKEYKASYSFFTTINELGSFETIDMGDFTIQLSVVISGTQLVFYILGNGNTMQVKSYLTIDSAVFI